MSVQLTDADLQKLSTFDRVNTFLQAAAERMPAEAKAQIEQMLTPQALHVIEGVIVLWGISHWFGFGELFDTVVLATGVVALGADAVHAARLAMGAFITAYRTEKAAEFLKAADDLAQAADLVGIDLIATLLFRWKRPRVPDLNYANFHRPPAIVGGGWRYRPQTYHYPFPSGQPYSHAYGLTDIYGDIHINTNYSAQFQQMALFHELVHQFFRPKIAPLRQLRGKWTASAYKNSYLRRYVEEALCQTVALCRQRGFNFTSIVEGIRFPMNGAYDITVARLAQEVGELFLGPIKLENDIYYMGLSPAGSRQGQARTGDSFDARRMSATVR